MSDGRQVEFLGATVQWIFSGFRGKVSDYYSRGSGTRQLLNFLIGIIVIVVIGVSLALFNQRKNNTVHLFCPRNVSIALPYA
jgi:hypothetical protein